MKRKKKRTDEKKEFTWDFFNLLFFKVNVSEVVSL